MAILQGYKTLTYVGWDTDINADLTTPNAWNIPYTSNAIAANQAKNESSVLTGKRAMSRPFFGNIDVAGGLEMPFDAALSGLFFKALCGNVDTTDLSVVGVDAVATGTFYHVGDIVEDSVGTIATCTKGGLTDGTTAPTFPTTIGSVTDSADTTWVTLSADGAGLYKHEFTVDTTAVPYMFVEKVVKPSPSGIYEMYRGCKVNNLSINVGGDGELLMSSDIMGVRAEDPTATTQTGTKTDFTTSRIQFQNFKAGISAKSASSNDAITADSLKDVSVEITNNLAGDEYTINSRGYRREIPEGLMGVSGSINALFEDTKALQVARDGAQLDMAIGVYDTRDAANVSNVQIHLSESEIEPFDTEISGPAGINVSYNYMAYQDSGSSIVKITLVNTTASY